MMQHPQPRIVVEQLNASQWHVIFPDGHGSGVTNWVNAMAYALLCGTCDGHAVESLDLNYDRLRFAHTGLPLEVKP